jgi:hypothetical protein
MWSLLMLIKDGDDRTGCGVETFLGNHIYAIGIYTNIINRNKRWTIIYRDT